MVRRPGASCPASPTGQDRAEPQEPQVQNTRHPKMDGNRTSRNDLFPEGPGVPPASATVAGLDPAPSCHTRRKEKSNNFKVTVLNYIPKKINSFSAP